MTRGNLLIAIQNVLGVGQARDIRPDVQMPVMNGYDATRAIRESERGSNRHIPIVALTAHAMKGDRELCLRVGMDDYLGKPIHPMEMLAVIERWSRQVPAVTVPSLPLC